MVVLFHVYRNKHHKSEIQQFGRCISLQDIHRCNSKHLCISAIVESGRTVSNMRTVHELNSSRLMAVSSRL